MTATININRDALAELGWVTLDVANVSEEFLNEQVNHLASTLGIVVPPLRNVAPVARLRPKEKSDSRPNTLSNRYSLASFPFHSDTAHWTIPCRYVVLACLTPGGGNRATMLFDSHLLELAPEARSLLQSSVFRIVNGKNSFFSTILERNRPFIRHDPGCMRPAIPTAQKAVALMDRLISNSTVSRITWIPGRIVVFDNWRVLHARGEANASDNDRVLLRAYAAGN